MTKFKKIIVAVMVSLMLILPLGATASAADLIDPDNINGIAKYFGIDAMIVRLIFVALTIWIGGGIMAYIVCMIMLPEEDTGNVTNI